MHKKKCPTFRRAGSSVVTSTPDYLAYRAPSGFRLRVSRLPYRAGHSLALRGQQAFLLGFPVASGSFRSRICIPPVCMSATTRGYGRMARSLFCQAVGFWCHRASLALRGDKSTPGVSLTFWIYYSTGFLVCQEFFSNFLIFFRGGRGLVLFPQKSLQLFPLAAMDFEVFNCGDLLSLGWLYYSR